MKTSDKETGQRPIAQDDKPSGRATEEDPPDPRDGDDRNDDERYRFRDWALI